MCCAAEPPWSIRYVDVTFPSSEHSRAENLEGGRDDDADGRYRIFDGKPRGINKGRSEGLMIDRGMMGMRDRVSPD